MQRKAIVSALLTAGLIAPIQADAALSRAGVIEIATLGGDASYARAINDLGQVAGYARTAGNANVQAYLWDAGNMVALGSLGSGNSHAYGIGADGAVVGNSVLSDGATQHAFLWRDGVMRDLGVLGGNDSYAMSVNALGQVVGASSVTGSAGVRSYLWSNGGMQDLGSLGGFDSDAAGINNLGQVVGTATRADGVQRAYLWSQGTMQDLGSLGGANGLSFGIGVNDAGQVAGHATTLTHATHAFLYSDGVMRDLGTLGGDLSLATGLSAGGQVVGRSQIAGNAATHAFIYDAGRMIDLNLLAPTGWSFSEATSINRHGQIVGNGTYNGQARGYMLTLHPDWQGGDGDWDGSGHWGYSGLGVMNIAPGLPHDVVINPAGSATIRGAREVLVRSLVVGGKPGQIVTLDLNHGTTATRFGTRLDANGVISGSGRLAGGLQAMAGSRVSVAGGEAMQITGGSVINAGKIQVLGTAASPASLEVGGDTRNAGQINLQNANAAFTGGLANTGQVNLTFGTSNVSGQIDNQGGKIIVANGASASFYDSIVNNGEVRVSAGGAANFFARVSGAGSFTGAGQSRFEGGFAPGNSPALVTVGFESVFAASSPILMELGGVTPGNCATCADKIVFNGGVTLEGGDLVVAWWGDHAGQAGDVYDLFDWNGSLSGSFGQVILPTLASGLAWDTGSLYTLGEIRVAAVPEPESYGLMLAGLGLVAMAARRKRCG